MDSQRICKKCLTREMTESGEQFKNMWDYIDNLSGDVKTSDPEYERRLSICKECEMLLAGMCRKCGCYVEMRAALKTNECPDYNWTKES